MTLTSIDQERNPGSHPLRNKNGDSYEPSTNGVISLVSDIAVTVQEVPANRNEESRNTYDVEYNGQDQVRNDSKSVGY